MNWLTILPTLLKLIDRLSDWLDAVSTNLKEKHKLDDINKTDKAVDTNDDAVIIAKLQDLIKHVENRKNLS